MKRERAEAMRGVHSVRLAVALAVLAAAGGPGSAAAATATWDGGAGAGNEGWNQTNNWDPDGTPVFDNTLDVVFHAVGAARLTNCLGDGDRTIRSLTFNADADGAVGIYLAATVAPATSRVLTLDTDSGSAGITVDGGAAGSFTIGVGGSSGLGSITLADDLLITHNGSGDLVFDRPIGQTGTRGLTKDGSGKLILRQNNTYSGTTTLNGGTLLVGNTTSCGTGPLELNDGTTFGSNTSGSRAPVNRVTVGGNIVLGQASGGTGALEFTNVFSLGGATRVVTVSNSLTTLSGVVTNGGLTKAGPGTLTLGGVTNTFAAGDVTVNAGLLQVGTSEASRVLFDQATPRTITVNSGGTLAILYRNAFGTIPSTPTTKLTVDGGLVTSSTGSSGAVTLLLDPILRNGATLLATKPYTSYGTYQLMGTVSVAGASASTITTGAPGTGWITVGNGSNNSGVTTFDVAEVTGNANADLTVGAPIKNSGTGGYTSGLTKTGDGTLTLTSTNTYTGATTISAGTLQLGGSVGGLNDASSVAIAAGATLHFNRSSSDADWPNDISGSGTILKSPAAPEFGLTGSNSFSGLIDIQAGKIALEGARSADGMPHVNVNGTLSIGAGFLGGVATIGNLNGTGVIDTAFGGGAGIRMLQVAQSTNGVFSGAMRDAANGRVLAVTKAGPATLTLSGANTFTGPTTINEGTLQIGDGGASGTPGAGPIVNQAALVFNRDGALTVGGVISGGGSLTKTGAGAVTLAGSNTYTGATTVEAGTLTLPAHARGGGTIAVSNGATLGVALAAADTLPAAALALGEGAEGRTGSEFALGNLGSLAAPALHATNLTVNGTNVVSLTAAYLRPGQYPLIAYDTASGLTADSFTNGTLPVGVNAHLTNHTANKSVDLVVTAVPDLLWRGQIDANWDFATLNWTSVTLQSDEFYFDGAYAVFDDGAAMTTVSLASNVSPSVTILTNAAASYSFTGGGAIAGEGMLIQAGGGTVSMGLSNTYAGATLISNGVFVLGASEVIPDGAGKGNVLVNGVLDLNGTNETINGLSGGGVITNSSANPAALTLGNNNAGGTFSGVVSDAGSGDLSLTKTGSGTITLGTIGRLGGVLTLGGGTLALTSDVAHTNVSRLAAASTLDVGAGATAQLAGFTGGVFSLVKLGAGALVLTNGTAVTANFHTRAGLSVLDNITVSNTAYDSIGLVADDNGTMIVRGNAVLYQINDLNVADTANAVGRLFVRDNAQLFLRTLWVGKNSTCQGYVYQTGGLVTNAYSGGADWRIAGNSSAGSNTVGGYYMCGGSLDVRRNFQIGAYGCGELVISGGVVNAWAGWPSVGRYAGSTGRLAVVGGTFNQLSPSNGLIVGEAGAGWLAVSNGGLVACANTLLVGGADRGTTLLGADGRIVAPGVAVQTAAGVSTFLFDGGVLQASTTNNPLFLQGLDECRILDGGAVVDSAGLSITIAQELLSGGTGGLQKQGTGTLTLSTGNTYVGWTTIAGGTLALGFDGSVAASAGVDARTGTVFDVSEVAGGFTLGAAQTLKGAGTVTGSMTMAGTLTPGASIGTLAFANDLTLDAGGRTVMEIAPGAAPSHDQAAVAGALTYGGTLVVTNLGGALTTNDSFALFTSGSITGWFSSVSLPSLAAGLAWDTNTLRTTGILAVIKDESVVPSAGGMRTFALAGGAPTLTFTGTVGATYVLQTATNVAPEPVTWVGISTSVVPPSGIFTNSDPAATNRVRFYRTVVP